MCPVALIGELDLLSVHRKCTGAASYPKLQWHPLPWWKIGLDLEKLEPEIGVSWGFSYAQWQSLPYQGQGWL